MRRNYQLMAILLLTTIVTGCSCSKDTYEFYSYNDGTNTYKCSTKDKRDSSVKSSCAGLESFSIVLKNNGTANINMPYLNINDEEVQYKVDNGSLYIKDDDETEYYRLASYSDNEILVTVGNVTITLRK